MFYHISISVGIIILCMIMINEDYRLENSAAQERKSGVYEMTFIVIIGDYRPYQHQHH